MTARLRHLGPVVVAALLSAGCASTITVDLASPSVTPETGPTRPVATSIPDEPRPTATPTLDPQPGAAGVGDPYFPDLGNGGYDVARYVVALTWDPTTREVTATTHVEATATQDLSSFNLDLHGLVVDEVAVDGVTASYRRDLDEMTITPATPLATGTRFVTTIDYHGQPRAVPMGGVPIGGWFDDGDTVYVAGEPSGAQTWFPVNNHPSDRAFLRVELTVPDGLTAVANGRFVGTEPAADNHTTWVYETTDTLAPYLITLAIGDFVEVDGGDVDGVQIRSWFERSVAGEAARFAAIADGVRVFGRLFGPYPFEAYGVLVVDASLGGALETQTLSIFGTDFLDRGADITDVVVHELAHQWFGDDIALAQWDDIWLNEGFATYSEYLYREQVEPLFDIDTAMADLAALDPAVVALPVPGDPGPDQLFAAAVYLRGALTLHALRRTIGDNAFFTTLRHYVETFGSANVVTSDFTGIAEEISGQRLDDFFEAWLHEESLPPLPGS